MTVSHVGWSQAQAWPLVCASLAVTGCMVATLTQIYDAPGFAGSDFGRSVQLIADFVAKLMLAGNNGGRMFLLITTCAATLAMIVAPLWKLRSTTVAREPFLSVTDRGIYTPKYGVLVWGDVLSFHSDDNSSLADRMLHVEVRASASAPQRFVALFCGFLGTTFLTFFPDRQSVAASWDDLTEALEWEHAKYAGPKAATEKKDPSALHALQSARSVEVAFRHPASQRWIDGIFVTFLLALIAAPWAYFILASPASFTRLTLGEAIGVAMLGVASAYSMYLCLRRARNSLKGRPYLVINDRGIHHFAFGFIPWENVRLMEAQEFRSAYDDYTQWLCAHVTEPAYRGVSGMSLDDRVLAWRARRNAKSDRVLPLASMGDGDGISYSVNGVWMPPGHIGKIVGYLNSLKHEALAARNSAFR